MKRVSARAPKVLTEVSYADNAKELALVASEHVTRRMREEGAIVALLSGSGTWWYPVEVARQLGITYTRAAWRMKVLEREGFLKSEARESPVSGTGRRYYRIK